MKTVINIQRSSESEQTFEGDKTLIFMYFGGYVQKDVLIDFVFGKSLFESYAIQKVVLRDIQNPINHCPDIGTTKSFIFPNLHLRPFPKFYINLFSNSE